MYNFTLKPVPQSLATPYVDLTAKHLSIMRDATTNQYGIKEETPDPVHRFVAVLDTDGLPIDQNTFNQYVEDWFYNGNGTKTMATILRWRSLNVRKPAPRRNLIGPRAPYVKPDENFGRMEASAINNLSDYFSHLGMRAIIESVRVIDNSQYLHIVPKRDVPDNFNASGICIPMDFIIDNLSELTPIQRFVIEHLYLSALYLNFKEVGIAAGMEKGVARTKVREIEREAQKLMRTLFRQRISTRIT